MIERFSEDHVIATITRLTRPMLVSFIEAEFVKPDVCADGWQFGRIDIARLELLCDLSQDLDLNETALAVVISLLDQLHAARHERAVVSQAIQALPEDLRQRILAALTAD